MRAAASGVLLALSFPKYGHPAFAWIALAPLLAALADESPSRFLRPRRLAHAFRLGVLTGVVYFAGTLYWITHVMAVYGDLAPWVAVLVNAALVVYLALFPGIFAVVVRRLFLSIGRRALLAAPVVWVATELGRTYLFTGFPWVLLGYSQARVLPIAQLASAFGVYGVSMLIAAVSAVLAWMATYSGDRWRPASAAPAVAVVALVLGVAAWGSRRAAAREWTREGEPVRVGLIQGNVEQARKWDPAHATAIFEEYVRMTRQAIGAGAEFVLWPESSTPFRFEEDRTDADRLRALVRQARVPVLLGSDQFDHDARGKYYNAAFLLRSDGTTAGVYRKTHLVPFGEYVPLKRVFFFAAPLVEAVSDFSAGAGVVLLPVGRHEVSTAICYEIVYPDLVRQFVSAGSELLTTITNDAWFGASSAPYQHFEQASMRAIEEGRYLVRAANTGISGIVDPYGRVVAQSAIFEPAVVVGEARYLRTSTFYARHGDVLAYASAIVTLALLVLTRRSSLRM
ncbi:MAG: apolipoprotein N-acyltransferase [Acidobacteria bacterium]|nr:apolipoprotein N-acyltransferase [Acidobacteriota bacterium]